MAKMFPTWMCKRGGRKRAALMTEEEKENFLKKSVQTRRQNADSHYVKLAPIMIALRSEGFSLQVIADRLNAEGHTTRRCKQWSAKQVSRVLGQFPYTKEQS